MGDLYLEITGLNAGQSKTVTFTNVTTDIPGTWRSWAKVDANDLIQETSNADNLWSAIPNTTWLALPPVVDLSLTKLNSIVFNLAWTYPISPSRYKMYRSDDPYFIPGPANFWQNVTTPSSNFYPSMNPGAKMFYKVTAERDLP